MICSSVLITTIFGVKRKPALGDIPRHIKGSPLLPIEHNENKDIEILGIITDKVTVPKMDGSRGSALYKIPFRLNRVPSQLWKELFVRNWNSPPRYTTMHRPGIASVVDDEILLNGTTIEEVREYHRETLKLCIEKSNTQEKNIARGGTKKDGFESIPRTRFVRIFSRFQRVSISSFRPAVKPKPFDR